jgi:hypothetical protein
VTDQKFPPRTPAERAEEAGVPLTQRNKLDLSAAPAKRFISKAEALFYGDSWFFDATTGVCRAGHRAPKRVSNSRICSDCERLKKGLEPVYGKSLQQKYYSPRKPKDPTVAALAAPATAAPLELPKRDTDLLAKIADLSDIDAAAAACGWTRGQVDGRASANEKFATALNTLCERNMVPRTVKPAATFTWTPEKKRNVVKAFVDSGLMLTAREAVGASASDLFAQMDADLAFAAAIDAARPRAAQTLAERAAQAATQGRIDLLKYLEANAPKDDLSNLSPDELNAELRRLIDRFDKQGLIHHQYVYRHAKTGAQINLREYEAVDDSNNADLVS